MSRLLSEDLDHVLGHTEGLWGELRGNSIFLTGATGFVGTWLLETLLWAHDRLDLRARAVVLTRNPERFRKRAPHLAAHPAVTLLSGQVTAFDYPDGRYPYVIHAATESYRQSTPDCPLGTFDADTDGTRGVLEFARTHGVRRLLFTSSGAVYGRQPADLTHIPEGYAGAPLSTDIDSAYGHAKRVSEYMCATYGRVYGFDAIIARLFAFLGPMLPLNAHYAVGNFIGDVLQDKTVRISGDGTPYRSYLYAADLAVWLWTMLFRGKAAYPYNVGSSQEITIADLARTVVRVAAPGTDIQVAGSVSPGWRQLRYVPDTSRAETELGLRPVISLEEGIRRTCTWHRANPLEAAENAAASQY
jgi:dTDP-glucose 4,6-dehydratase